MCVATFGSSQIVSYFEFTQTDVASPPDVVVVGVYEGYADVWNHVFTVGVNPPQDVDYGCCYPNINISSAGNLSDISCTSMWTSNCTGDRTLVSVTAVNSTTPELYWLTDATTSCVYITINNLTDGNINTSIECRQQIGTL